VVEVGNYSPVFLIAIAMLIVAIASFFVSIRKRHLTPIEVTA